MNISKFKNRLLHYYPELHNTMNVLVELEKSDNSKIKVVVYGSYNAGKSSLLNSIIGAVDNEYFPTNDVPETRENKTFEKGDICFVDTPGLDVNDKDTDIANAGVARGDVILFVHKLTAGSIQKQDLDALKRIFDHHANPKSVLFVLTTGEVAASNNAAIEEITRQVHNVLSNDVEVLVVSNSVYQKGVRENKPKLIEFSGIEHLQVKLGLVVDSVTENITMQRMQKRRMHLEEVLKAVQKGKRSKKAELDTLNVQKAEIENKFVQSVQKLGSVVRSKLADIASI